MAQSNLNFMIGLPRSGKSTICREWLKHRPHAIVVEDDAIRRAITGDRFNARAESQVYAIKYGMIRTLLEQDYTVMVDDTHTSVASIQRLLEIDVDAQFCMIYPDPYICIKRAQQTKQEDLTRVIWRQHENLRMTLELGDDDSMPTMNDYHDQLRQAVGFIRQDVINRQEYTKRV